MSGVRFETVADLFASFPTAAVDTGEESSPEPSLHFVRRSTAEDNVGAAIAYCAYLLPRRDAVWWAVHCVANVETLTAAERECLELARHWALKPEEARRRKALEKGLETSARLSGAWVALAAGWSGGSIAPADAPPLPAAPSATPQAVRGALLSAATRLAPDKRQAMMAQWVEQAIAWVAAPIEYR